MMAWETDLISLISSINTFDGSSSKIDTSSLSIQVKNYVFALNKHNKILIKKE